MKRVRRIADRTDPCRRPYLSSCNRFPTFHLLNSVFKFIDCERGFDQLAIGGQ